MTGIRRKFSACLLVLLVIGAFAPECALAVEKAEEKDPLDEIIVEDANSDPSGREFVKEHRRLEAEVRARRKDLSRDEFFLRMRIAKTDEIEDFDREIGANPSFGLAAIDPEKRTSVAREEKEKREWEAQGWRPPTLREFALETAHWTAERLRPHRFAIHRFEPQLARNPTATAFETSASEAFSEEETNEVTDIMKEVFRSHRYQERIHPGARQRRP